MNYGRIAMIRPIAGWQWQGKGIHESLVLILRREDTTTLKFNQPNYSFEVCLIDFIKLI